MAALGLACHGWASLDRAVPLETTVENGDVRRPATGRSGAVSWCGRRRSNVCAPSRCIRARACSVYFSTGRHGREDWIPRDRATVQARVLLAQSDVRGGGLHSKQCF